MAHCRKFGAAEYTLKVCLPKTVVCESGSFTSYCITIQTTSVAFRLQKTQTWRRFSEFEWLRRELDSTDNWRSPPSLPPKRFWNRLEPKFVERRRHQLEQWTHEVLSDPDYLSNAALHLFLQTELTVDQIQDYLKGNISEDRMEEIWNNHGKLYNYQAHNLLHNNFRQEPMEIHYSPEDNHVPVRNASISVHFEEDAPNTAGQSPQNGLPSAPRSMEQPPVDGVSERSASRLSSDDYSGLGRPRERSPDSGFQEDKLSQLSGSSTEATVTISNNASEILYSINGD